MKAWRQQGNNEWHEVKKNKRTMTYNFEVFDGKSVGTASMRIPAQLTRTSPEYVLSHSQFVAHCVPTSVRNPHKARRRHSMIMITMLKCCMLLLFKKFEAGYKFSLPDCQNEYKWTQTRSVLLNVSISLFRVLKYREMTGVLLVL